MMHQATLPHGMLTEDNDSIVVTLSKGSANVTDIEQLEELKKPLDLFMIGETFEVTEEQIFIYYKKPQGYKPISHWHYLNQGEKQKIAKAILQVQQIEGTQFTTYIIPDNIYCNEQLEIKFVHRGIRSILPPAQEDGKTVVYQIKCLILSFFTDQSYADLLKNGLAAYSFSGNSIATELKKAKSLQQLADALDETYFEPKQEEPEPTYSSVANNTTSSEVGTKDRTPSPTKKEETKQRKGFVPLLGTLILGGLLGFIISYYMFIQPHAEIATSNMEEASEILQELEQENEELQVILAETEDRLISYQLVVAGEREEAINAFENLGTLTDEDQTVLARSYLDGEDPLDVVRGFELDNSLDEEFVTAILNLESEEANEALLSVESDSPPIQLEQAWLNNDFETVVQLAREDLPESSRAQRYAVEGTMQNENLSNALELAEEFENVSLQIEVLEAFISEIEDDDDITDDDEEDAIDEILDQIDDLQ